MRKFFTFFLLLILSLSLASCGKDTSSVDVSVAEDSFDVESVVSIAYTDGNITLRFSRSNDKWTWTDDTSFPLDTEDMSIILDTLNHFETLPILVTRGDEEDYGLNDPDFTMTVSDAIGQHSLIFASETEDSSSCYMKRSDEAPIYEVEKSYIDALPLNIYDMAELPTFPSVSEENLKSISISTPAESTSEDDDSSIVSTTIYHSSDTWLCLGVDVSNKVSPLLEELESLAFAQCIDYSPADGAAEICGLLTPAITLDIRYVNSVGVTSNVALSFGNLRSTDTCYYVTLNSDSTIYTIPSESVQEIFAIAKNGI